jgi:lipid II:glycine glycyltransferase (peptidoglycan interpeptide bridge formation enzyme)
MFAKIEDEVVGACILIHAYGTCYYHFAVSSREPKGIAHRMVTWAAELARSEGYKRFHLGGGVNGNDGLFTFKSGFSDLRLPVYKHESKHD